MLLPCNRRSPAKGAAEDAAAPLVRRRLVGKTQPTEAELELDAELEEEEEEAEEESCPRSPRILAHSFRTRWLPFATKTLPTRKKLFSNYFPITVSRFRFLRINFRKLPDTYCICVSCVTLPGWDPCPCRIIFYYRYLIWIFPNCWVMFSWQMVLRETQRGSTGGGRTP